MCLSNDVEGSEEDVHDMDTSSRTLGHFSARGKAVTSSRRRGRQSLVDSFTMSLRSAGSSVRTSIRIAVNSSFVLHGSQCSVRDLGGKASVVDEVFNICKNLVGSGVLSLSGGMALFYSGGSTIYTCLLAGFWITILAAVFGYFCLLIAKVCDITKSATFRGCWEESVGHTGALIVSLVNAVKPALGNLAYLTILSQTLASLFETIGWAFIGRIQSLLLITVLVLLPLCLLKNLTVLAPCSLLGTAAILLTAVSMMVRCLDGSYSPGGQFHEDIPQHYRPNFGSSSGTQGSTSTPTRSVSALPFVCMVFEAYVMHYNSPRFYTELRSATIQRFALAVSGSFAMAGAFYATVAVAGFLTFGENCDGYILNNYSPRDPLATVCRMAIALSTILTFPIVFMGFRDGILDVLDVPPEKQTSGNLDVLTVLLLGVITSVAIFCTDLGMINAVGGGTLGTVIVFLFPTVMYRDVVYEFLKDQATEFQRKEVAFACILMFLGLVLGATGVFESIIA